MKTSVIARKRREPRARIESPVGPGPTDPHPWRATIWLGLLTVALGMAYTLVVAPFVEHSGGWWIVPDAWVPLRAAGYVASGALGYVYQSTNIFVTTPLLPILLVPAALAEQHFGLVEGFPQALPYPSMWLVYAPYALALCTPLFYAVRTLGNQLGIHRGRLRLQITALVLVMTPAAILWGHYEDVLAVAFVMLSLRALLRDRPLPAALLLGVAVAFKQWALLGVPLLVAASPPAERRRGLAASLAVPGLFVALPLAVDWANASAALIWTRSYPQVGHRALWVSSSVRVMVGNPSRAGAFVVAIAIAWWLRGRREPHLLLAGLAVVFLSRLLFEPVLFSYYVCPALAMLLLHERVTAGTYRRTILLGIALLLLFAVHPPIVVWWAGALILGGALARPAVRDVWARRPLASGAVHSS